MICRALFDFLLKLLNLVIGIAGLGMIGYGIYLLVEWMKISSNTDSNSISSLLLLSLSNDVTDELSKAWFVYAFIGLGVLLFVMSCFGCIGTSTRNGCCLSFYSFLLVLLILVELALVAIIFIDHNWKDIIPTDKTGNFETIYNFLKKNWKIAKWVSLGAVIIEALAFVLAMGVHSMNQPSDDEDDEEYMVGQRNRTQPLINNNNNNNNQSGSSQVPTLEPRPIRNDAWSQRMKDKYGIDVSSLSHNQSNPTEERRSKCVIL